MKRHNADKDAQKRDREWCKNCSCKACESCGVMKREIERKGGKYERN